MTNYSEIKIAIVEQNNNPKVNLAYLQKALNQNFKIVKFYDCSLDDDEAYLENAFGESESKDYLLSENAVDWEIYEDLKKITDLPEFEDMVIKAETKQKNIEHTELFKNGDFLNEATFYDRTKNWAKAEMKQAIKKNLNSFVYSSYFAESLGTPYNEFHKAVTDAFSELGLHGSIQQERKGMQISVKISWIKNF
jgi:hypothetical protein